MNIARAGYVLIETNTALKKKNAISSLNLHTRYCRDLVKIWQIKSLRKQHTALSLVPHQPKFGSPENNALDQEPGFNTAG
jgi:hypothetical protein